MKLRKLPRLSILCNHYLSYDDFAITLLQPIKANTSNIYVAGDVRILLDLCWIPEDCK